MNLLKSTGANFIDVIMFIEILEFCYLVYFEPLFNSQVLPHCVNVPRVDCEQRAKHYLSNKQINLKQTQTHETKNIYISHNTKPFGDDVTLCVCVLVQGAPTTRAGF
jgi:hypothetical protein